MFYDSEVDFSRRDFLGMMPAGLAARAVDAGIDRRSLVSRHNPLLRGFDGRTPLSVGNGEFAFTVDTTGLQTFPRLYDDKMPLCTLSQWGWHTSPGGEGTLRLDDHPSMLGALGVLPGRQVDRETMRRTLKKVLAEWKWADTWGWDFPMVAMTAASLGEKQIAADVLLMDTPKNTWLANGHNGQRANLPLYLPGNGGLLLAVAHMAAVHGFPDAWQARAEGLPSPALH